MRTTLLPRIPDGLIDVSDLEYATAAEQPPRGHPDSPIDVSREGEKGGAVGSATLDFDSTAEPPQRGRPDSRADSGRGGETGGAVGSAPQDTGGSSAKGCSPIRGVISGVWKVLYLFSGAASMDTTFAAAASAVSQEVGREVALVPIDVSRGELHDMLDEDLAVQMFNRIHSGEFIGGIATPPHSTYSGKLRGTSERDAYGFVNAAPKTKEAIRKGTLLSLRALGMCRALHEQELDWA